MAWTTISDGLSGWAATGVVVTAGLRVGNLPASKTCTRLVSTVLGQTVVGTVTALDLSAQKEIRFWMYVEEGQKYEEDNLGWEFGFGEASATENVVSIEAPAAGWNLIRIWVNHLAAASRNAVTKFMFRSLGSGTCYIRALHYAKLEFIQDVEQALKLALTAVGTVIVDIPDVLGEAPTGVSSFPVINVLCYDKVFDTERAESEANIGGGVLTSTTPPRRWVFPHREPVTLYFQVEAVCVGARKDRETEQKILETLLPRGVISVAEELLECSLIAEGSADRHDGGKREYHKILSYAVPTVYDSVDPSLCKVPTVVSLEFGEVP